jgi:hypothetical protein
MDNVQKHNICTSVPSSQTFRSYLVLWFHQCMIGWQTYILSIDKGLVIITLPWRDGDSKIFKNAGHTTNFCMMSPLRNCLIVNMLFCGDMLVLWLWMQISVKHQFLLSSVRTHLWLCLNILNLSLKLAHSSWIVFVTNWAHDPLFDKLQYTWLWFISFDGYLWLVNFWMHFFCKFSVLYNVKWK